MEASEGGFFLGVGNHLVVYGVCVTTFPTSFFFGLKGAGLYAQARIEEMKARPGEGHLTIAKKKYLPFFPPHVPESSRDPAGVYKHFGWWPWLRGHDFSDVMHVPCGDQSKDQREKE